MMMPAEASLTASAALSRLGPVAPLHPALLLDPAEAGVPYGRPRASLPPNPVADYAVATLAGRGGGPASRAGLDRWRSEVLSGLDRIGTGDGPGRRRRQRQRRQRTGPLVVPPLGRRRRSVQEGGGQIGAGQAQGEGEGEAGGEAGGGAGAEEEGAAAASAASGGSSPRAPSPLGPAGGPLPDGRGGRLLPRDSGGTGPPRARVPASGSALPGGRAGEPPPPRPSSPGGQVSGYLHHVGHVQLYEAHRRRSYFQGAESPGRRATVPATATRTRGTRGTRRRLYRAAKRDRLLPPPGTTVHRTEGARGDRTAPSGRASRAVWLAEGKGAATSAEAEAEAVAAGGTGGGREWLELDLGGCLVVLGGDEERRRRRRRGRRRTCRSGGEGDPGLPQHRGVPALLWDRLNGGGVLPPPPPPGNQDPGSS